MRKENKELRKLFLYETLKFNKDEFIIGASPITNELYRETLKTYIHELYISTVLAGESLIEKLIRDQIEGTGKIHYYELLDQAEKKELINSIEKEQLKNIHEKVRNLYIHDSIQGNELNDQKYRKEMAEELLTIIRSIYKTIHSNISTMMNPVLKNVVRD
ncbi:hypothetical protein ACFVS2_26580 [Brevibacillus sp. NPDC058079]|uniref:hypothetical protein n=1 Tax=Brevibacillus sp. NPDC058079 TaxID=3346330 RepID=UPI0036E39C02